MLVDYYSLHKYVVASVAGVAVVAGVVVAAVDTD